MASTVIVAVPGVVPAIKDTITMPVSSDVETEMLVLPEKLPRSVVNVTDVPTGTGLPVLSNKVAVIIEELDPSAGMLVGLAVSVIEAVVPSVLTREPSFEDSSLAREL